MKKLIVVIMTMVLLVAVGCSENQKVTVWGLSGQDMQLQARLGVEKDNTEVGAVVKYSVADDIEFGPEPDIAGAYLIFHLTQEVTIEDTPDPSPLQPFLEALHARPYAGVELVGNVDRGNGGSIQPNWLFGTAFTLAEESNVALVVEYADGDQAPSDVSLGLRARF